MRTYIKKLQNKKEDARKRILIGSLIVCMSFVLLVWVNSLGYKFNNRASVTKTEEELKPFALFGKSFSETYNNISASVGDISSFKKVKEDKQIDLIPVEYQ